jgi:predicted XRE-type DNA-binding protein
MAAKSFKILSDPIMNDPERRARIDEIKRGIRAALALHELRETRQMTQQQVAEYLAVTQSNVSRIERQDDLYLSTLKYYVEALGGHLEVNAVFDDETVSLLPGS